MAVEPGAAIFVEIGGPVDVGDDVRVTVGLRVGVLVPVGVAVPVGVPFGVLFFPGTDPSIFIG